MARKLNSVFNPASFDKTFIRQLDDFSCTAAACATIARLYGLSADKDIGFFKKELRVGFDGAKHKHVKRVCKEHLPFVDKGKGTYRGGIAFGYIQHKPDGEDHAVIFLARKDDTLIYYDPFDHLIFKDSIANMRHNKKEADPCKGWVANFPAIEGADFDFWEKHAVQNPFRLQDQAFWIKKYAPK